MLQQGDKISYDFKLFNQNNELIDLASLKGKYLVIYFYPKDDTPGCTAEACSFRDFNSEIKKLGAEVIGISKDTPKSHKKFENNHKLNFTLLSDPEHKLQDYFGVWGLKKMMGREFMGTLRTTFLISPEGEVLHVWTDVNTDAHGEEVYNKLKFLISNF